MIDLPDYGYTSYQIVPIDPAGVIEGSLGGPSDIVDRPGYRYSIQFTLPQLSAKDARVFQTLLEQGAREDVSYPWPMDTKALGGASATVNGASPAGAVIPITGLPPNYIFRQGQPLAVISEETGFVHKAKTEQAADGSGTITLSVFPITRKGFLDGDTVEVGAPRIRGVLTWSGAGQGASGGRPFSFTISERR